MEQKEIEEFLIKLAGGMTGAAEDITLEAIYKYYQLVDQFPYVAPHPNLPAFDDIIVGGLAIPPYVIGLLMEQDGKKKGDLKAQEMGKDVKTFGEGNVLYSGGMLLHEFIRRLPTPHIDTPSRFYGARVARRKQPASNSGPKRPSGIVTKL